MTARHQGEAWTADQDEVLRQGCIALCEKLGRTWSGVKGRIDRLMTYNWHVGWPENPPAPTAFQVLQSNEAAFLFLRQQIGVGKTVPVSKAAQVFQPVGLPYRHGVLVLEQLAEKGLVVLAEKGKRGRTVTIHG